MPEYREVEITCNTSECEGDGNSESGYCPSCINKYVERGWTVRRHGVLENKDTGAKLMPSGRVTINASLNPRMAALMAGDIEVEDLDDEELAKGMCRGMDGKFPKKRPSVVPKVMYDQMTRVLFSRAEETLKVSLSSAAESLAKMAADPEVDASTRLKAATWLYERLMGKAPTEVKISSDKPFEHVLTQVARGPRPPVAPASDMG